MINRSLLRKGARFIAVGVVGFATDAGLLWITTTQANIDPYSARLMSFSSALIITWILNSSITFEASKTNKRRQFNSYLTVQVLSFGLNYSIYSGIVWLNWSAPLVALVVAALVSMVFSFCAMNLWVFRDTAQ
ncbi:MAG: GtrA family protein [Thalassospira sp.]|uniref:GtrA family protein n=1 Tax=Thalassospira sp. TaxID=1912094 RepID=UPI003A877EF0